MCVPLLHFEHQQKSTLRYGLAHASIYPYGPFDCSNGTVILAVQSNAEWERLCLNVLQQPELLQRQEFSSNADRVANRESLDAVVKPLIEQVTAAEMTSRLESARIAYANFTQVAELGDHPALRRVRVELPGNTFANFPRPAGRSKSFTPNRVPETGEHTQTIRAEFDKI